MAMGGGFLDEARVLVDLQQRGTRAVDLPPGGCGGGGVEIAMAGKFCRAHLVALTEEKSEGTGFECDRKGNKTDCDGKCICTRCSRERERKRGGW